MKNDRADAHAQDVLAKVQIGRMGANKPFLDDEVFFRCRDRIKEVVTHFSPSGSNGRLPGMLAAIDVVLKGEGVFPEGYWADAWIRSGSKPMDAYNKKTFDEQPRTVKTSQSSAAA